MRGILLIAIFGLSELLASAQTVPSVGIFMDFDSVPGKVPIQAMEHEVDRLLKPSGVTLNWSTTRENHGDHAYTGLVVLKFKGRCKVDPWMQPISDFGSTGERHALGSTKVANGNVLPYTEVECDQVRQALAYLRPGADQKEKQLALGRALGRVVAHELYHIFAKTTHHAARGLAKAVQPLEELVSPDQLTFLDSDTQAMGRAFVK